jgi:hypothetical protein
MTIMIMTKCVSLQRRELVVEEDEQNHEKLKEDLMCIRQNIRDYNRRGMQCQRLTTRSDRIEEAVWRYGVVNLG